MKKLSYLFAFMLVVLLASCQKDQDENASSSDINSYLPLTVNNQWTYKAYTIDTNSVQTYVGEYNMRVTLATASGDEKLYYLEGTGNFDGLKFWKDGYGNCYKIDNSEDTTKIIPTTIAANARWTTAKGSVEITNVKGIFGGYGNLMELTYYNSLGVPTATEYYKKGVGYVGGYEYSTVITEIILSKYNLK